MWNSPNHNCPSHTIEFYFITSRSQLYMPDRGSQTNRFLAIESGQRIQGIPRMKISLKLFFYSVSVLCHFCVPIVIRYLFELVGLDIYRNHTKRLVNSFLDKIRYFGNLSWYRHRRNAAHCLCVYRFTFFLSFVHIQSMTLSFIWRLIERDRKPKKERE